MNLRDLVRTQKGDRTYATLSADCGGYPSDKRLQQLATQKQKNFVDPVTVQALARGLRVTEAAVLLAAAEDLGLDVRRATPRLLDVLPASINDLDDQELHMVANMVRQFLRLIEEKRRAEMAYTEAEERLAAAPPPSAEERAAAAQRSAEIYAELVELEELNERAAAGDELAAKKRDEILAAHRRPVDDGQADDVGVQQEAARKGQSTGRAMRKASDAAAETPDPKGPEYGA